MARLLLPSLAMLLFLACPAGADYVGGLDPEGDGYLALRTGPGTGFNEMQRLLPGTILSVKERRGKWRRVQLEDGTIGWAFGAYILPGKPNEADATSDEFPADGFPPDEGIGADDTGARPVGEDEALVPPAETTAPDNSSVDVDGIMQDIARGLNGES
jgi:hypothetical protein